MKTIQINKDLQPLIDRLKKDHVKVFISNYQIDKDNITYCFFSKNDKIGYAQIDRFYDLSFSTVHKPNKETGTGFQVKGNIVFDYHSAFYKPMWAQNMHSEPYKDLKSFLKAKPELVQI